MERDRGERWLALNTIISSIFSIFGQHIGHFAMIYSARRNKTPIISYRERENVVQTRCSFYVLFGWCFLCVAAHISRSGITAVGIIVARRRLHNVGRTNDDDADDVLIHRKSRYITGKCIYKEEDGSCR